jgi:DNA damage-binding protein 1
MVFSFVIGKEGELTISTIDDIRKLHINTIPLDEHPHRISHQKHSCTFAIFFAKYSPSGSNGQDMETRYIHLIDDQTFEIISSFALDAMKISIHIIV